MEVFVCYSRQRLVSETWASEQVTCHSFRIEVVDLLIWVGARQLEEWDIAPAMTDRPLCVTWYP
jgi:hypothetical protein